MRDEIQNESLAKEVLIQAARTYVDFEDPENRELKMLSCALREPIYQSTIAAVQTEQDYTIDSGPAGN